MTSWRDYLSSEANELTGAWPQPCDSVFNALANRYPKDLLKLVQSKTMSNAAMTFAVESLGNIVFDNDEAFYNETKNCLLELARQEDSSMVQEGALYGLSQMGAECRLLLLNLASHAKSPTIKKIAYEFLTNGL